MKAVLGEYGKLIVMAIVLCSILPVLFGEGKSGLIGMLRTAGPVENIGDADTFSLVQSIFTRKPPTLKVEVKKLNIEQEYNLLDAEEFQIEGNNQEGETVDILIWQIINPEKKDITKDVKPEKFIPLMAGEYSVVYQAREDYKGSVKTVEKEYRFIAD